MTSPPGIPICGSCARPEDKSQLVRVPKGSMGGPWRSDGSKPPIFDTCSICGHKTIMGLYLKPEARIRVERDSLIWQVMES
jgi:hypothetical protein